MSDRLEQDLEELLARRAASTEAELAAQRAAIASLPPRRRRPPVLAWAAVVAVAVGLAAAAVWRLEVKVAGPAVDPSPSVDATAPAQATAVPSPTAVAEATPPPWTSSLVSLLECKWPVAPIGEAVRDAPIGGEVQDTPDDALAAFLAGDARVYATIPLEGYTRRDGTPGWALYANLHEGRPVALIAVQRVRTGWVPFQVAACDAADFDPSLRTSGVGHGWVDATGSSVPAADLTETPDCYDGTLLRLDGRLYGRDLRGAAYDRDELLDSFAIDASLPPDAIDTGYRQHERRLYSAHDQSAVYVVSPLRVERWPRVKGDEVFRTDCN